MSVWLTTATSESNVNIDANTSTLNLTVYVNWDDGSWNHLSPPASVTIDGTTYDFNKSFNLNNTFNGREILWSGSKTITHNDDGSKTASFSAWLDTQVSSGIVRVSGTKRLSTIPRASQPTLSKTTFTMGETITIYTNRQVSTFTHTLEYEFNGRKSGIASNVGASTTWATPISLANYLTNATSGKGIITCKTYNGSQLVGTKSVDFTANVPSSVVPTISTITATEVNEEIAEKFAAFIEGKSKIHFSVSAAGAYGSSVNSVSVNFNGQTIAGSGFDFEILTGHGSLPVKVTATDTRGRTATRTQNVTVLPYALPSISYFRVQRCNANGVVSDDGECVKITKTFMISPCNNKNDNTFKIEYQLEGASSWTTLTTGTGYSVDDTWISDEIFSQDYSYRFRLTVTDYFGSSQAAALIDSSFSLIDYRNTGRGIAFGKASEKDAFEVEMDAEFNKTSTFFNILSQSLQADGATVGTLNVNDRIMSTNSPWKTPSLLNGWKQRSGYAAVGYYKDLFGFVHLKGAVQGGTGTAGTGILTLPEGYRPEGNERFIVPGGTDTTSTTIHLDVGYNGNVIIKAGPSGLSWVSLVSISFYAPYVATTENETEA